MAKSPIQKVARCAIFGVFALIGAVLIGPAPIVGADASPPAHVVSFNDPMDPDPLVQDPPEVQSPLNPNQKTLGPQHRRSHHRTPNHT